MALTKIRNGMGYKMVDLSKMHTSVTDGLLLKKLCPTGMGVSLNLGDYRTWEVCVSFRCPAWNDSSSANALLAGYGENCRFVGIQLFVRDGIKTIWMGIPNADASAWNSTYADADLLGVQVGKWYALKAVDEGGSSVDLYLTENYATWRHIGSIEKTVTVAYRSVPVYLGCNFNEIYKFNEYIDLKNTYVKCDGQMMCGSYCGIMQTDDSDNKVAMLDFYDPDYCRIVRSTLMTAAERSSASASITADSGNDSYVYALVYFRVARSDTSPPIDTLTVAGDFELVYVSDSMSVYDTSLEYGDAVALYRKRTPSGGSVQFSVTSRYNYRLVLNLYNVRTNMTKIGIPVIGERSGSGSGKDSIANLSLARDVNSPLLIAVTAYAYSGQHAGVSMYVDGLGTTSYQFSCVGLFSASEAGNISRLAKRDVYSAKGDFTEDNMYYCYIIALPMER